jgi:hypothetical protein
MLPFGNEINIELWYINEVLFNYTRLHASALNRAAAQTRVKAGVNPELFKGFNITVVPFATNPMKTISRMVPAKHPLRPSNSDPTADSKP